MVLVRSFKNLQNQRNSRHTFAQKKRGVRHDKTLHLKRRLYNGRFTINITFVLPHCFPGFPASLLFFFGILSKLSLAILQNILK